MYTPEKPEVAWAGGTPALLLPDSWNLSAIFLETIRDYNVVMTPTKWEYEVIFTHEIGHSGRDDMTHIEDGLMNAAGKRANYYDDETVTQFRKEKNW